MSTVTDRGLIDLAHLLSLYPSRKALALGAVAFDSLNAIGNRVRQATVDWLNRHQLVIASQFVAARGQRHGSCARNCVAREAVGDGALQAIVFKVF
jgi:hypothetical protein